MNNIVLYEVFHVDWLWRSSHPFIQYFYVNSGRNLALNQINHFIPKFTIVIFIYYKLRIAVAIMSL